MGWRVAGELHIGIKTPFTIPAFCRTTFEGCDGRDTKITMRKRGVEPRGGDSYWDLGPWQFWKKSLRKKGSS